MKWLKRKPKKRVNDHLTPETLQRARILTGEQLAEAIAARRPQVITQAQLDAWAEAQGAIAGRRQARTDMLTKTGGWFPIRCKKCTAVMWTNRRQACPCGERVQLYLCTPSMWLGYALGKLG